MTNSTYVCFTCRTTERVPSARIARKCRKCRSAAEHVYYKFRIPKKNDDAGWEELQSKVRPMNSEIRTAALSNLQKERDKLERILSTLPANKEQRRRAIEARISINRKLATEWEQWRQ